MLAGRKGAHAVSARVERTLQCSWIEELVPSIRTGKHTILYGLKLLSHLGDGGPDSFTCSVYSEEH